MLMEVMRLAVERGILNSAELARALDTGPELVDVMLEELVRRHYLQAVLPGHSAACERCPMRAACLYRCQPRVWMLTRKGAALIHRLAQCN